MVEPAAGAVVEGTTVIDVVLFAMFTVTVFEVGLAA
jgi:hypothetical protein